MKQRHGPAGADFLRLADDKLISRLGQGTWHMGERSSDRAAESRALRLGIDLGLTLIDTAEMYADGGAEEVVAEAIRGRREEVFLVSKAYPQNASKARMERACEASLKRLGTEQIDLYLLHWRGSVPLAETIAAFEELIRDGKIARWGVSNFDPDDMVELFASPGGGACAVNQVLYNPQYRGIEFDLLPWALREKLPIMAYSPVGQGGSLLRNRAMISVAARHNATPAQIALAWALRHPHVIAIPKAASEDHVRQNAAALTIELTPTDLAEIDASFPPPRRAQTLAML